MVENYEAPWVGNGYKSSFVFVENSEKEEEEEMQDCVVEGIEEYKPKTLREVRKLTSARQWKVRAAQFKGKLKVYYNAKGYICYDAAELKEYEKTAHVGRPPKKR